MVTRDTPFEAALCAAIAQHPKCKGRHNHFKGAVECGYETTLICEDCKYGGGHKDPEAKCNQEK